MSDLKNIVLFEERLQRTESFWKYMHPEFESHLENYLPIFEKHRADSGLIPSEEDWKQLPFGNFANDSSWKWRRESLSLFQKLTIGKNFANTLEIGPWNGWLTKYLAQQSNAVFATDYFTCNYDGVGNIAQLHPNIIAIQCDVENAGSEFKPNAFDLIVLNHCMAYVENPAQFINSLIPLLNHGGLLISLGNSFYRNPEKKILENENAAKNFREKYQTELYIKPVKGYLDQNDVHLLQANRFAIVPYPQRKMRNLYSKINREKPFYFALTYQS